MNTMHNFTKEGKIALMLPILAGLGNLYGDMSAFNSIQKLLDLVSPKISDEEMGERITFAIVGMKKYGATPEQMHAVMLKSSPLDWCFDKFVEAGGLNEFTEPVQATKH